MEIGSEQPVSRWGGSAWLVMAPSFLLSLLGIAGLVVLLISGAVLDRNARDSATVKIASSLQGAVNTLTTVGRDNAWWDEAFEKLYLNFDRDWADANFGVDSITGSESGVDALVVADADGRWIAGYGTVEGGLGQDFLNGIPDLAAAIQKADAGSVQPPLVLAGMIRTPAGAALAAIVPVTPNDIWPAGIDPRTRVAVIVLNLLQEPDLSLIEKQTGTTGLRLAAKPEDGFGATPVAGFNGKPAGWLLWTLPKPGTDLVEKLIVPAVGATLLLLALSIVAGRRILIARRTLLSYADRLQATSAMLEAAVDAGGEGLCVISEGSVKYWNTDFTRLIGSPPRMLPQDQAGGMHALMGDAMTVLDGDPAILWDALTAGEWLLLDRESRILWLRRTPFTDGTLILVRDVTADRERQQELINARRAAEAANQDKSNFLAQMSHELRTPLNAILGFAEVISVGVFGKVQPEIYRGYAENIQQAGRHLLSLINDVLDLSKIEAGRMEARIESTDIAALAEDARILLADKAGAKGVALTVEGEPDVAVKADPRMLKQIMINLLSNAVKFTPKGGRVWMTWRRDLAGMAELTVKDTGIGMSPEDLKQALLPFGQAKKRRETDEPGTGLGLPIVAHLARLQGGSFEIDSTPGAGTVVVIRVPVDAPAETAPREKRNAVG